MNHQSNSYVQKIELISFSPPDFSHARKKQDTFREEMRNFEDSLRRLSRVSVHTLRKRFTI